jgi:putative transposase
MPFTLPRRTFFVTSACNERRPLLRADEPAQLLLRTVYKLRVEKKFLLHEFVVMHDHTHFILTPDDLITIEKVMQLIKGRFSFEMGKKYPKRELWQRSFTLHRIEDERDYLAHREYIHDNPVKSGYVSVASEYPHSSANPRFKVDPMPASLSRAEARKNLKGRATHG